MEERTKWNNGIELTVNEMEQDLVQMLFVI